MADDAESPPGPEPQIDPEVARRRELALGMVRKYGDPGLRSTALPVDRFDARLISQAGEMGAIMNDALGIGLAATQIGIQQRMLVYRVAADAAVAVLVNPTLEYTSSDTEVSEEGCLSLPAVLVDVRRPVSVRVAAYDEGGEAITVEASGLEARVIQHELDHLNGVLILDHAPRSQRKAAMKAMRARLEELSAA